MEKCRRMKRPQRTSKNWIYSWLWKSSRIRQQSYRSESFAMKTDILMSGSTVKNHISFDTGFEYNVMRRTSFRSWFQACHRVPSFLLSEICMVIRWQDIGKAIWENPFETRLREGVQLGMLIRTPWKRIILICVCGWHQIGWKETKSWSDVESTQ